MHSFHKKTTTNRKLKPWTTRRSEWISAYGLIMITCNLSFFFHTPQLLPLKPHGYSALIHCTHLQRGALALWWRPYSTNPNDTLLPKPISGTSKDELAEVLTPPCEGTYWSLLFVNSHHYHTELFLPRRFYDDKGRLWRTAMAPSSGQERYRPSCLITRLNKGWNQRKWGAGGGGGWLVGFMLGSSWTLILDIKYELMAVQAPTVLLWQWYSPCFFF